MSQENVEIVRRGFEAYTAGDLGSLRELYDPGVVWHHLEGWPEGAGGKDGDAVDEQFAQPRQPSDMHAQHWVDVQVGPEAEGLGDLDR